MTYLLTSAAAREGTVPLAVAALASGIIMLAGLFYDPPARQTPDPTGRGQ